MCQSLHHFHISTDLSVRRVKSIISPAFFFFSLCKLVTVLHFGIYHEYEMQIAFLITELPSSFFLMWRLSRCNQSLMAKGSLFSWRAQIGTGKWKNPPHFLSSTATTRYQRTKCSSGDTYRSALHSQSKPNTKLLFHSFWTPPWRPLQAGSKGVLYAWRHAHRDMHKACLAISFCRQHASPSSSLIQWDHTESWPNYSWGNTLLLIGLLSCLQQIEASLRF